MTTSVTALCKSSFNWEGVSDECDSWKLGNAVNILEESSSESSTIKLLSVMAVAIKSLWAAWKLLCSTLNQQQQRIKVIIIEAAHVTVYIIATGVVFFFSFELFFEWEVYILCLSVSSLWVKKQQQILWHHKKFNHVCHIYVYDSWFTVPCLSKNKPVTHLNNSTFCSFLCSVFLGLLNYRLQRRFVYNIQIFPNKPPKIKFWLLAITRSTALISPYRCKRWAGLRV